MEFPPLPEIWMAMIDLKPIADEIGFEIVEQYGIKMHRSLTRIISVICKKFD